MLLVATAVWFFPGFRGSGGCGVRPLAKEQGDSTIMPTALVVDVPVVMVTTEAEIDQMTVAIEAGATEYVMKPFTKEILADKLRLAGLLA
jgi:PleD family two-component response regulator